MFSRVPDLSKNEKLMGKKIFTKLDDGITKTFKRNKKKN